MDASSKTVLLISLTMRFLFMGFASKNLLALILFFILTSAVLSNNPDYLGSGLKLFAAGKYSEAENFFSTAIEHANNDPQLILNCQYNLAEALVAQQKYEAAEDLFKSSLQDIEKVEPLSSLNRALLLSGLGRLYLSQNRYSEAEPLLKESLKIRQEILEPNDMDIVNSLDNLAGLYVNKQEFLKAEPLFKKALEIKEKTLKPNDPRLASTINNLATTYSRRGDARAEDLFKKAISVDNNSTYKNNLAWFYLTNKRYVEAEPLFKEILQDSKANLGENNTEVARNLNNLALLYKDEKNYQAAEPLYKRSLAIREKLLDPDNSNIAQSVSSLGLLYELQGKYTQAEALDKRALEISERTNRRADIAKSLNNLALLYCKQNKYSEAEPLFKKAISLCENNPEIKLDEYKRCVLAYSKLLRDLHRSKEAEELEKKI